MTTREEPRGSILRRYLEDAIAAEHNFEAQLRVMAKQGDNAAAGKVFADHADETRRQHDRLVDRLNALGGSTSTVKTFMAHLFAMAPKAAQFGHDDTEIVTQNLIMGFAIENSEIAMYEALANTAAEAGDLLTEQLAREIQEEEHAAAAKVWNLIASSARHAYKTISQAA